MHVDDEKNNESGLDATSTLAPPSSGRAKSKSQTLTSRIYDQILQRLLNGDLAPGQVFNRRAIAAELDVSVAPVLEAMVQLQAEGLIETLPRRGTRVRQPTHGDLRGQLIVREALECEAARLACGESIRDNYKKLHALATRIDGQHIRSFENWKDEVRFHHRIVILAGIPTLTRTHDWIMKIGLCYAIHVLHPDHTSAERASHAQYVESLQTDDPDQAELATRTHIRTGKETFFTAPQKSEASFGSLPGWLS